LVLKQGKEIGKTRKDELIKKPFEKSAVVLDYLHTSGIDTINKFLITIMTQCDRTFVETYILVIFDLFILHYLRNSCFNLI